MSTATQQHDDWTGEGYDASAGSGGGVYLRLKNKGQKVRLRLVSGCYRYWDQIEKDGETKQIKKCAWIAIHKELINGKPEKKVVIFQNGPMVYGLIKDLTESEGWGDPTEFDIEITRTEEQGRYYTVTPFPKPMGPISADDRALVDAAGFNLVEMCKRTPGTGSDGQARNKAAEPYDPFADD